MFINKLLIYLQSKTKTIMKAIKYKGYSIRKCTTKNNDVLYISQIKKNSWYIDSFATNTLSEMKNKLNQLLNK